MVHAGSSDQALHLVDCTRAKVDDACGILVIPLLGVAIPGEVKIKFGSHINVSISSTQSEQRLIDTAL